MLRQKYCTRSDTCDEIVAELEEVNDELDKLGIPFVFTDDKAYIATLKLDAVPIIGMFRNGDLLQFDGSIENREAIQQNMIWLFFESITDER